MCRCGKATLTESQKAAVIAPVLKKPNADPDELKNYRPISNLTFISKVSLLGLLDLSAAFNKVDHDICGG